MWNKYDVTIQLVEPMLGVVPKNPEVYKTWIELKAAAKSDEGAPEPTEERSWTGFNSDIGGLYIYDYHVKGYFKEVASILPRVLGIKKKSGDLLAEQGVKHRLDNWLFVEPRRVYLGKDKPDGVIERPLRAQTLQGARIALARSDYINAGANLSFTVVVLDSCPITAEHIETWLKYGEYKGFGQFRTGGYGKFKLLSINHSKFKLLSINQG